MITHQQEKPKQKAEAASPVEQSVCRFCGTPLKQSFVDLGMSPLCESFLAADQLNQGEVFYPLHVYVCEKCFLVQLQEYVSVESIFTEYAYFSSFSDSWLAHAKKYTDQMIERFGLSNRSHVVELASNDGYLLQYFVARGVPVLGIEPAANVAEAAVKRKGVPTLVKFFGRELATELAAQGKQADLLLGNNVLAQVPDINSFVAGMKILLADRGVITLEFPHLLRLMQENQFDTIYHEHFSYFSLITSEAILSRTRPENFRRRGAFDAWWLVAHLRLPRRRRNEANHRPRQRAARPRGIARIQENGLLQILRRASKSHQARVTCIPDRSQKQREDHRRLRRPGKRQHPAELLRHSHRFHRLHRRPQPL